MFDKSNANLLQLELKGVFFALNSCLSYQRFLVLILSLSIHFSPNRTELFQENLLSMLSSLSLNIAHDLASLLEVELGPVTYIHLENISL
jgi:hypothetical protein